MCALVLSLVFSSKVCVGTAGSITPTTYGKEGTKESTITGVETGPFLAVAEAMEVIPRTLVQNAGGNAIRVLTELRVSL